MKLTELKSLLQAHPAHFPRFVRPAGDRIPAHYHVTEVGHVAKRFIDCGGKLHETQHTCLLQTHVGEDFEHRLTAERLGKILQLGGKILPSDDLELEVEYDDGAITQSPITAATICGEEIELQLGEKHTDCLAKARCGMEGESCGTPARAGAVASCC